MTVYLPTFLDAAMAQIQTTIIALEERYAAFGHNETDARAFDELNAAYARIRAARKLLT